MADNRDICERLEAVAGFGGTHLDGIWSEAAKEIRSLHYYVARLEEDLASADLEIEGLRKYSSKQALDIVTLGQEVGRLREALTETLEVAIRNEDGPWVERARAALAEKEDK